MASFEPCVEVDELSGELADEVGNAIDVRLDSNGVDEGEDIVMASQTVRSARALRSAY